MFGAAAFALPAESRTRLTRLIDGDEIVGVAMYALSCVDEYKYQEPNIFVLDIVPLSSGLAAPASDQTLALFDPLWLGRGPLRVLRTRHGNTGAVRPHSWSNSIICTAGENGTISVWDLRQDVSRAEVAQISVTFGGKAAHGGNTTNTTR